MSRPHTHAVSADIVFDGVVVHRDSAVLLEGSHIIWLGPRKDLGAVVPVKALPPGAWLAPGFVDVQVNGGGDVLFNDDPTPAAIARIAAAHRRFGTTAFLPTLISDTKEKMRASLDAVRRLPENSGALSAFISRDLTFLPRSPACMIRP
jgi:N-acetylglucosamine-6-phosphate deacetylase